MAFHWPWSRTAGYTCPTCGCVIGNKAVHDHYEAQVTAKLNQY